MPETQIEILQLPKKLLDRMPAQPKIGFIKCFNIIDFVQPFLSSISSLHDDLNVNV